MVITTLHWLMAMAYSSLAVLIKVTTEARPSMENTHLGRWVTVTWAYAMSMP